MGQYLSLIRPAEPARDNDDTGGGGGGGGTALRRYDSQDGSMLLQLPYDVLLAICQSLCAPSKMALSLTSRAAHEFLYDDARAQLRRSEWHHLLPLLAREAGDRLFYCHLCNVMHVFQPAWHPGAAGQITAPRNRLRCLDRQFFTPDSGQGFVIAYHHAHLVMNRALHGAPHGLPLERFHRDHLVPSRRNPIWRETWRARAIAGELFLSCTHALVASKACGTAQELRAAVESLPAHDICHHEAFGGAGRGGNSGSASASVVKAPRVPHHPHEFSSALGQPGGSVKVAQGSCGVCLTDYVTTFEWRGPGLASLDKSGWHLVVTSYHQLGACRSPYDPKWQSFAVERSSWRAATRHADHPSGAVISRWASAQ